MLRRCLSLSLFVLSLQVPAWADAPSDTERGAARQIGSEGLEAYKRGEYDVALDKLERAYAVVKAPSLGLWSARALAKKGRLVEASERYLEVTRLDIEGGDVHVQEQAQSDAAKERMALLPRIPQLTIVVQGGDAKTAEVKLDGEAVSPALLGATQPVNPGEHRVTAQSGERQVSQAVTLAESESKQVVLRLDQGAASVQASSASPTPPPAVGPERGVAKGKTQRTAGWIGIAVGGAGLVAGGVTGLLALSKRSSLKDEGCDAAGHCFVDQKSDVDSYNVLRTVSTVGLIVGGVGLAAGVTLLLTAPKPSQPGLSAFVGVNSAGIRGRF